MEGMRKGAATIEMVQEETSLEKGRRIQREKREAGDILPRNYNPIIRAQKQPNSLRLAVDANCFYCIGGTEDEMPDPGWREEVRDCTAMLCPLHPHRPYQRIDDKDRSNIRH